MGHTKGPWRMIPAHFINSNGHMVMTQAPRIVSDSGLVTTVDYAPGVASFGEMEANAALIAAAPEMYELLTRMHPLLVAFRDDYDKIGLERVLAVIKQVKGE